MECIDIFFRFKKASFELDKDLKINLLGEFYYALASVSYIINYPFDLSVAPPCINPVPFHTISVVEDSLAEIVKIYSRLVKGFELDSVSIGYNIDSILSYCHNYARSLNTTPEKIVKKLLDKIPLVSYDKIEARKIVSNIRKIKAATTTIKTLSKTKIKRTVSLPPGAQWCTKMTVREFQKAFKKNGKNFKLRLKNLILKYDDVLQEIRAALIKKGKLKCQT